jgi:hypothetical protein
VGLLVGRAQREGVQVDQALAARRLHMYATPAGLGLTLMPRNKALQQLKPQFIPEAEVWPRSPAAP